MVIIQKIDSVGLWIINAEEDTIIRSGCPSITAEQAFKMVDEFEKMEVSGCRVDLRKEIEVSFGDKLYYKFMHPATHDTEDRKPIGDGWYIYKR